MSRIKWHTEDPPKPSKDEISSEYYLVTYQGGGIDIARWSNINRFWGNHPSTEYYWTCAQYCRVAAWMELPEEYVPEGGWKDV